MVPDDTGIHSFIHSPLIHSLIQVYWTPASSLGWPRLPQHKVWGVGRFCGSSCGQPEHPLTRAKDGWPEKRVFLGSRLMVSVCFLAFYEEGARHCGQGPVQTRRAMRTLRASQTDKESCEDTPGCMNGQERCEDIQRSRLPP